MLNTTAEGSKQLKWYQPRVRAFATVLSILLLVLEAALLCFEYMEAKSTGNPIACILLGMFGFHILFTLAYVIGITRKVDCYMVPWLTLQLIFMTTFSLFVIVWWIATVLSLFEVVNYNALDYKSSGLTNGEFFVVTGVVLTVVLAIASKFSLTLYKGFTVIREINNEEFFAPSHPEPKFFASSVIPPLKPSYV